VRILQVLLCSSSAFLSSQNSLQTLGSVSVISAQLSIGQVAAVDLSQLHVHHVQRLWVSSVLQGRCQSQMEVAHGVKRILGRGHRAEVAI
uniref:Uncharacterized protein n=1 Tax=Gasterosteus aculeatus TaxID=69293 RepID=G3Q3E7_GASAC